MRSRKKGSKVWGDFPAGGGKEGEVSFLQHNRFWKCEEKRNTRQLQNFSKYVLTIAVGKSGLDRVEKFLFKLRRGYG